MAKLPKSKHEKETVAIKLPNNIIHHVPIMTVPAPLLEHELAKPESIQQTKTLA